MTCCLRKKIQLDNADLWFQDGEAASVLAPRTAEEALKAEEVCHHDLEAKTVQSRELVIV